LHDILDRHKEVLQKRWNKKSKEKRKKMLLTAWPKMPSTHCPDFKALQRWQKQCASARIRPRPYDSKSKDAFLWPYINLKDLTKGNTLLLFLNARGHHLPSIFCRSDYNAPHIGFVSGAIIPAYLGKYAIVLVGNTPETYSAIYA
jgi:hypothetical protein